MKTSTLTLALLVIASIHTFAQPSSSTDYAWRLDSIMYDFPPEKSIYEGETDSVTVYNSLYTRYTYGEDSLIVLSARRFSWEDTTILLMPTRTVYSFDVDSGMYLKEQYSAASSFVVVYIDSVDYIQWRTPTKKQLYLKDSIRTVFDDEGHVLRQIRNYDYITYNNEWTIDTVTGEKTYALYPSQRYIFCTNDTSASELVYNFTTDEPVNGVWPTSLYKETYYTYSNHRLISKEYNIKRSRHANGQPATYRSTLDRFNHLGVLYHSTATDISWNDRNDTTSVRNEDSFNQGGVLTGTLYDYRDYTYDSLGMLTKKVIHPYYTSRLDTSWEKTYTYVYDSIGQLKSLTRSDRFYDLNVNLDYRRATWQYINGVWQLRSEVEYLHKPNRMTGGKEYALTKEYTYNENGITREHLIEYDSLWRTTLEWDSTLSRVECERYKSGSLVYKRITRLDEKFRGWITIYESQQKDTYSEFVRITDNNIRNGVRDTLRWIDRTYKHGFDNYQTTERYTYNTGWTMLYGEKNSTVFDEDGTPSTATGYELGTYTSYKFRANILYMYTYNAELDLYVRTEISRFGINEDGTPHSYTTNYISQELYTKEGENVGYRQEYNDGTVSGTCHTYEYDELGRIARTVFYESKGRKDSVGPWTQYYKQENYYYPAPNERVVAYVKDYKKDSLGNWAYYSTRGIDMKTFDFYDDHGLLLTKHAYRWENDTVACDTLIYNQPTYNADGQLVENIQWYYTYGIRNSTPVRRERYFYRPDGTLCDYYAYSVYSKSSGTWTEFSLVNKGGLGDLRYDEKGRIIEQTFYTLDSTATALVPTIQYRNHYETGETDWNLRETFIWQAASQEWTAYASEARPALADKATHVFDDDGNIIERVNDTEAYYITYGRSLSEYPVLSPASFGIQDDASMQHGTWLNPTELNARIVSAHHVTDKKTYSYSASGQYMARYFYTQLREEDELYQTPFTHDITVEPDDTTSDFTWPAISGGAAYTLIVWADAEHTTKICTMHLAADGTLLTIDFSHAPRRTSTLPEVQNLLTVTINALTPATQYWYTLYAYDDTGLLIESASGTFRTTGIATALVSPNASDTPDDAPRKFIRNGHIYIRHGGKIYTIQGQLKK